MYTNNQEELRQTAFASIPNLVNGIAKGIEINRNLSVFTTLPMRMKLPIIILQY